MRQWNGRLYHTMLRNNRKKVTLLNIKLNTILDICCNQRNSEVNDCGGLIKKLTRLRISSHSVDIGQYVNQFVFTKTELYLLCPRRLVDSLKSRQ